VGGVDGIVLSDGPVDGFDEIEGDAVGLSEGSMVGGFDGDRVGT
jgi:hypothetical protein